ncbi:GNAT family N-acetyltransferase [Pseudoduganella sp. FT25W]|uniref:GNAT family N-acetyltransferase n=1 Tax=Duganella alba TaxID=2666081 RepID=A0A6L5QCH9_9BURK|nr:GNAT family N-acetyltransferase [Duganella alba]MRX07208.1 GNAT family N-acetyltransferase [Duganella alba]MRX15097.1 GNAT family N-acetyltransferase [Duganella alba]
MKIRTLQADDVDRLLAFETANRTWFEQHVEARDPAFYSAAGVAAHIADYLDSYKAGAMHPCVLTSDDDAAIVGRANLRRIDHATGTGEVGYRIAHDQARQGLGSQALAHLMALARTQYKLRILNAWISPQNLGSRRILEKAGFIRDVLAAPTVAQVAGKPHTSHLYQCHL